MSTKFQFDKPVGNSNAASQEVRENFEGLGTTNFVIDNETLPANPRKGMLRIIERNSILDLQYFNGTVFKTILADIDNVERLVQAKRKDFLTPDTQWVFDHNLGVSPTVEVRNTAGDILTPTTVQDALTFNRVIVTHATNQTGYITVVG